MMWFRSDVSYLLYWPHFYVSCSIVLYPLKFGLILLHLVFFSPFGFERPEMLPTITGLILNLESLENLENCSFLRKIKENLELSGNFL